MCERIAADSPVGVQSDSSSDSSSSTSDTSSDSEADGDSGRGSAIVPNAVAASNDINDTDESCPSMKKRRIE